MSKDEINQFDSTASNNTDIEGINTSETMVPSAVNNAIRSLMSLLKKQDVGTHAMTSPDINGGTVDGANITVGSGKTLDVSGGTLTLANDQISGDKINGGSISSTFVGNLTGDVTGNASGTAATVTAGAQPNITSTGTLTSFRSTGIDDNADALAITIDSSENTGFGTTSPVSKITSEGDISIASTVDSDGGDLGEINFWNRTNAGSGSGTSFVNDVASIKCEMVGTGNNSGGSLKFFSKADGESKTEALTITGDQKIGIGTADPSSLVNIVGTTTSDFLVIQTNEDGAGTAPDVTLYRNSASPADNDYLGKIEYRGRNDNSQDVQYGYIAAQAVDVSDGTEDGRLLINSKINGADYTHIQCDPNGVGIGAAASDPLHLYKSAADSTLRFQWDAGHAGKISFREGGTETGRIEMHSPTDSDQAGNMLISTTSSGAAGKAIVFETNSSEAMRILSGGDVSMGGSLIFSGSGEGVYLGVTSATAANLLDDYEEGTWTANLTGSTSNPTSSVSVTGNYTKVGNLVWVQANFGGVSNVGAAGGIRVTGLPFVPSPSSQHSGSMSVHTGATIASGVCNISPSFESSYVAFYTSKSQASWAEITHNEAGAMWLYFSGTYKVA